MAFQAREVKHVEQEFRQRQQFVGELGTSVAAVYVLMLRERDCPYRQRACPAFYSEGVRAARFVYFRK